MDRNLALEMVRVTEAAALAAARWTGKGDAIAADQAAVEAMHLTLNAVAMHGTVILGEGERNSVDLLYTGEGVGSGTGSLFDLAVDALECSMSVAFGRSNAMAIVAIAPHGDFSCPPWQYLEKLAVGPEAAGVVDLNLSVSENLNRIARAKGYALSDLTVVVLDRARHTDLIERIKSIGARVHLIPDGDVAAAIATAIPGSGVDVLMGVGGTSAGILAAAAMRCLGGELLAKPAPADEQEAVRLRKDGVTNSKRTYRAADLARGDNVMFAATGVTDGDVLNGVCFRNDGATTHSLVLRARSGTRRFIVTEHYFTGSPQY